jgi:hypothetical protein
VVVVVVVVVAPLMSISVVHSACGECYASASWLTPPPPPHLQLLWRSVPGGGLGGGVSRAWRLPVLQVGVLFLNPLNLPCASLIPWPTGAMLAPKTKSKLLKLTIKSTETLEQKQQATPREPMLHIYTAAASMLHIYTASASHAWYALTLCRAIASRHRVRPYTTPCCPNPRLRRRRRPRRRCRRQSHLCRRDLWTWRTRVCKAIRMLQKRRQNETESAKKTAANLLRATLGNRT